jgi:TolB-like protein/tetratricopeptide (TPR) repeat protein
VKIIKELQRRNVIRVALLYCVGGWLVLQVGDLLFDLMGLPDYALRIVLGILILGFPVALVFSWVYEITPEGIRRDMGEQPAPSKADTSNKLNIAVIVTVCLAVLVLLGDRLVNRGEREPVDSTVSASAADELAPEPAEPAAELPTQDASVAVLPFLNLSAEREQEYFSDGLADTLLHRLAQVPELRVAARTSSFQFKDQNVDVREIARQLGVASVLEGSVQRQGEQVRITAQLIRGEDGIHLWSGVFDDTLDDIFRLQDEISSEVTEALTTALLDDVERPAGNEDTGGTASVAAYEAYLKGRDALDRGTTDGASEAVAQLELAVELDPEYALAWAYLVEAYEATARLGSVAWEATNAPKLAAAQQAVALAPNLVESQLALAEALYNTDRYAEGDAAVERAFELGPNHAAAVRAMASLTAFNGHMRDALRLTERAVLLDPLDAELRMSLARVRLGIGNVEGSLELARELAEAQPDNLDLRASYAFLLSDGGKPLDAMRELLALQRENPGYLRGLFFTSRVWLGLGDSDAALDDLEKAESIAPDRAYDDRAETCYLIGDLDCYRESTERYIALQRQNGKDWQVDFETGLLALRTGDPEATIALFEPRVMNDGQIDLDSGAMASHLATAYDLTGRVRERDQVLDAMEAEIRRRIANGLWQFLTTERQIRIAALRDNSGRVFELLARHSGQLNEPSAFELKNSITFRKLREDPRFPDLLKQREAQEAAWREALIGPS